MNLDDAQVGSRLTSLRGDMAQAALASQMKDRGFKWSQSTVWSVEKGDRPLRFIEAVAAAEILGVPLGFLLAPAERTETMRTAELAITRAGEAHDRAIRELAQFLSWMAMTKVYRDQLEAMDPESMSEEEDDLRHSLIGLAERYADFEIVNVISEAAEYVQNHPGGFPLRFTPQKEDDDGVDR